jgi:hypothetical protein
MRKTTVRLLSIVVIGLILSGTVLYLLSDSAAHASNFSNLPIGQTDPLPLPPVDGASNVMVSEVDAARYQIVYLVREGAVPPDSLLSPTNLLGQVTQADIAYSWDDVIRFNSTPVQALIVHQSAYDLADRQWIAAAYGRGMILASLNLSPAQHALLRNSECAGANSGSVGVNEMLGANFYVATGFIIAAENDHDYAIASTGHQRCEEEFEGLTVGVFTSGVAEQGPLNQENQIQAFVQTLIDQINTLTATQTNFANRFANPTAIP